MYLRLCIEGDLGKLCADTHPCLDPMKISSLSIILAMSPGIYYLFLKSHILQLQDMTTLDMESFLDLGIYRVERPVAWAPQSTLEPFPLTAARLARYGYSCLRFKW